MGTPIETQEISDAQADLLAAEALHELGDTPLDEPDEYADQCDYAGCYPWLAEVIHAHPHDNTIQVVLHAGSPADDDSFFTC
ncbi:MAG: hypothetical protein Q8K12_13885 [Thiobacillus sp.]|nr:hypothetical protein [Thiobacillus sp.]